LEAIAAAALWLMIPFLFFFRDIRHKWNTRVQRRVQAERAAKLKAEADKRLRDELAAKYPLPSAQQSPDARG
jgi:hypothetical protein